MTGKEYEQLTQFDYKLECLIREYLMNVSTLAICSYYTDLNEQPITVTTLIHKHLAEIRK